MEWDIAAVNAVLEGCFPSMVGLRIAEVADGRAVCTLNIEPTHQHPGGVVHGGVAYTMADTAMAWAIMPSLADGQSVVTIEQKMSYLDAARDGEMRCEANVIRRGKRIVLLEAKVTNGDKTVAMSTASFYIQGT